MKSKRIVSKIGSASPTLPVQCCILLHMAKGGNNIDNNTAARRATAAASANKQQIVERKALATKIKIKE